MDGGERSGDEADEREPQIPDENEIIEEIEDAFEEL